MKNNLDAIGRVKESKQKCKRQRDNWKERALILRETLRRTIEWAEYCSARLTIEQRTVLNWRDLEDARKILKESMPGGVLHED